MAMLKERIKHRPDDYYLKILSQADNGGWILRLPPSLKAQQPELEMLNDKVFSGRPSCRENLALAQQMSVNWCASKCRQKGQSLDDCLAEAI